MENKIEERTLDVIQQTCSTSPSLHLDTEMQSFVIDDIDAEDLAIELSVEFNLSINETMIRECKTVRAMVEFIRRKNGHYS